MARGKGKGSQFERDTCVHLSGWASHGRRDDIFWRSHGSGNRATSRGKRGKRTKGQYGDICATDGLGTYLLDVLTIELKRGYSSHTIGELLDKSTSGVTQVMESWFAQAIRSHEQSGSFAWAIIHKRDKKSAMIYSSLKLYHVLRNMGVAFEDCSPFIQGRVSVRRGSENQIIGFFAMEFESFLGITTPEHFEEISRRN